MSIVLHHAELAKTIGTMAGINTCLDVFMKACAACDDDGEKKDFPVCKALAMSPNGKCVVQTARSFVAKLKSTIELGQVFSLHMLLVETHLGKLKDDALLLDTMEIYYLAALEIDKIPFGNMTKSNIFPWMIDNIFHCQAIVGLRLIGFEVSCRGTGRQVWGPGLPTSGRAVLSLQVTKFICLMVKGVVTRWPEVVRALFDS